MRGNPLGSFAFSLICGAAALAILSWQLVLGFAIGIVVTLVAGTICASDLD
ncbi:MAG: hypothetical protein USCAAHI_01791 [Beijerinckiaceae bacterium]|nr:MAG: hypothetical protein USCAAHI_01791 [Beijerinckiaceae bacterium]